MRKTNENKQSNGSNSKSKNCGSKSGKNAKDCK